MGLDAIGQKKSDEVISRMELAAEAHTETGRLKVLLEEKDKQVTALTEIEKALAEVPKDKKNQDAKAIVVQALLTMAELQQARTQLAQALKINESGLSEATIDKLVKDAVAYGDLAKSDTKPLALKKANSDLQGQVTYLQQSLMLVVAWISRRAGQIPPQERSRCCSMSSSARIQCESRLTGRHRASRTPWPFQAWTQC
jgi:hypothetical protein